jgi:transcriptional regulator with XRE-family HTH domain
VDNRPEVLKEFGRRLLKKRQDKGYSQEELGVRAKLDRTYVSGVERGLRNIGLVNVAALAAALELESADLLSDRVHSIEAAGGAPSRAYRADPATAIRCGFSVTANEVLGAIGQTNRVLGSLPLSLYTTVDLKTQSGIVGAVFAAELAVLVGAIANPIEKGHPDIVPRSAASASEAELRNYLTGLEIKSTLGNVPKGSDLRAGQERIGALSGVTWQAHHRDVRSLMGLLWDFVGGTKSSLAHPVVTGVFYTAELSIDDWGAISGTTGRNTKVTGMTVSGRRKMGAGAIVLIDDARYRRTYSKALGGAIFGQLQTAPG